MKGKYVLYAFALLLILAGTVMSVWTFGPIEPTPVPELSNEWNVIEPETILYEDVITETWETAGATPKLF